MQIQVAVDVRTINEAKTYCSMFDPNSVFIFEFGAPLVVNCGVKGFVELKRSVHKLLYVDCKTMDFPSLEWSAYIAAGASEITGMAFAETTVLEEMAEMNSRGAVSVCVSTMGYPERDLLTRVLQLSELGFGTFVVHAAHADRQLAFSKIRRQLDILGGVENIRIFAAGGIGIDNVEQLRGYRLDRVIVGRGISKSSNPAAALREFEGLCAEVFDEHENT